MGARIRYLARLPYGEVYRVGASQATTATATGVSSLLTGETAAFKSTRNQCGYSDYPGAGVVCVPRITNLVSWGSPETGSRALDRSPAFLHLIFVGLPIPCDGGDGVVSFTAWDRTHLTMTVAALGNRHPRRGMATRPRGPQTARS